MSTIDRAVKPKLEVNFQHKFALIETTQGAKYLRRLCKHFSHKVPTSWDDSQGKIVFAMGDCLMSVSDSALMVRCVASNSDDSEEVAETMKSHFDRFAQTDGLILVWQ